MKKVRHYQNNFTKGELDPRLWGHGDINGYYEALSSAENVWISSTGSAIKRYGMVRLKTYENINYVKLYNFDNVSGSHFLIVVRAGAIDIFNSSSGNFVTTVSSSLFREDIIPDLYTSSYQDSVIFTHNEISPKLLKWSPGNVFKLSDITFSNIPTFEFVANDITPGANGTPSGTTGFIKFDSSSGVFQSSDLGKYLDILPVGRMKISKVNSNTSVSGFLEENLMDTAVVASGNWTIERGWEPLWGSGNGYPAVSGFHDGRLILGNFPKARSVFAYSVINSPFDFSTGDASPAYGGWRILSNDQRNAIYHIFSEHSLNFFCGYGEFIVDQSGGEALSKSIIRHDTSRGSVSRARPTTSEDGGIYFFQPNSTSISEFRYFFDRASHEANTFSKYAGHLINNPCSSALWKGDKTFETNIFFYVNADGTMISCTINLTEKIMAFTRVKSWCPFSVVCTSSDSVFVSVIDGQSIAIMKFVSGNYLDDGIPYESHIKMLPISNETSSYCTDSITVSMVYAYISETSILKIGDSVVYRGPPTTKKITHFSPTGWSSDGMVKLSDGKNDTFWQVNNVCRHALVGGAI